MKYFPLFFLIGSAIFVLQNAALCQNKNLKLVFIRHAERQENGDNLNCQGLNRSLELPKVLYRKFGRPINIYIPSIREGETTKRVRMLQTISPYVIKYGLTLNSVYDETDYNGIGKALLKETGTVLIVWEHKNISPILVYLGVHDKLKWANNDFDSIWIVTFPKGKAVLVIDEEQLRPSPGCPF